MKDVTVKVPDIHCDHCKMSLEGAVSELSGVGIAEVSIEARTVEVTFDEQLTKMDDIVQAIEGQGYEVAAISE
jgi:copper chaperone